MVQARRDALAAAAEGQTPVLEAALYTAQDGLPRRIGATRRQPNAVKTPDGRLWLAGVHGLTEVLPEAVQRNPRPPRVVVNAVRYIDTCGAQIEVSPETSGRYEVAPGGRAVKVAFAALSYAAPERVICATRLERNGQVIRESSGHDRQVTYELLSPGDYTIQITAANAHGLWNRTGVTVPLRMRPWYWQTVWFRVSAGVAMAGLVAGTVAGIGRQRTLALRRRTTALLAERRRIARDLHDGSQQMILATQMQIQLAREQWPEAPPDAREALATAEALNRQTLAETQLAVWDLRHETAPDTAVESLMRPVVDTAASAGRLEAQLRSAGLPWPLPSTQMNELRRLVMEAVVNVMKHARARRLEVKLGFEPDQLVVDVRDDGCGFDLAAAQRKGEGVGVGLTSMRERASRLKASFEVCSAPGQGTRVRTVVPRPAPERT